MITLEYGTANKVSKTYNWGADLLNQTNIYTFPDTVVYDGSSNGYGADLHLKENEASELVLTFSGGDGLDVQTTVQMITYRTGSGSETTILSADMAVDSAADTITLHRR